jgi:hypothetical protein
MKTSYRG